MKTRTPILAFSSLILLIVTSTVCETVAQENYFFKTFTTENGLPHNSIRSITQDKTGFLGIATWDGLSRYDGYEFRNYYHKPDDSTSLPYFSIQKVVTDKLNNLWIQPAGAKIPPVVYDRSNDTFINICKNQGIIGSYDLTTDSQGNIWLAGLNGLEKFDFKEHIFKHLEMLDEHSEKLKFGELEPLISCDNMGNIWIFAESNGVYQIYKSTAIEERDVKFTQFSPLKSRIYPSIRMFNNFNSFTVREAANGNRWLFTDYGFIGKNSRQDHFEEYNKEIPKNEFSGLPSFVWKAKESKIHFYDAIGKTNNSMILGSDQIISCSFFDKDNTMWYSTFQGSGEGTGLARAIKTPAFFKHYFLDQNKHSVLNAYFPVLKAKSGDIWAGPRNLNFLYQIKPNGQIIKRNKLDRDTWLKVRHPRAFLEDSNGIWIGYYNGMLVYFDYKKNKFSTKIFNQPNQASSEIPHAFHGFEYDGNDNIINGNSSVYRYTPTNEKMRLIWNVKNSIAIYCIKRDQKSNFWLGLQNSMIKCLDHNFNEKASYILTNSESNVEDICFGDNNDIWAALLGSGVAHLDLKTGKAEILTTANGLSNNTTYNILKDHSGNLWISTNHGISRYNPNTKQFRIFGQSDGLKIDEFNSNAAFQAGDGEMLFGGMGGVVGFYPDSLNEAAIFNRLQPLVITDFKVSGTPRFFTKAVYDMDTVSLKKGENNFQLSFACIDFKNADKIKYRYRLTGTEKTFTETDHQHRFVNYANLKPGDYRLEIEATNPEGEWNSKTALMIRLPPIYYQTLWFNLLVIIFLFSVVALFVIMNNKQIRLTASRKQAELRLESLRGQMNPHFIFNSLNSINYFISQNDRLSANRYIADFSRLIRSFLGNLSKEYIPFENELESLRDYLQLEHLRFGDKFDYTIEIPEDFEIEERMVFPGMVQPFIENAIWHGVRGASDRKGVVSIKFLPGGNDYCKCIVQDHGIGRKLSEIRKNVMPGRKSNGIGIVTERLRIFNQIRKKNLQLIIEDLYPDREETGTRVTIEIPVQINN